MAFAPAGLRLLLLTTFYGLRMRVPLYGLDEVLNMESHEELFALGSGLN